MRVKEVYGGKEEELSLYVKEELLPLLIIAVGRIITSKSSRGLFGIQQCTVNNLYLLQNVTAYFTILLLLVIHEKNLLQFKFNHSES